MAAQAIKAKLRTKTLEAVKSKSEATALRKHVDDTRQSVAVLSTEMAEKTNTLESQQRDYEQVR